MPQISRLWKIATIPKYSGSPQSINPRHHPPLRFHWQRTDPERLCFIMATSNTPLNEMNQICRSLWENSTYTAFEMYDQTIGQNERLTRHQRATWMSCWGWIMHHMVHHSRSKTAWRPPPSVYILRHGISTCQFRPVVIDSKLILRRECQLLLKMTNRFKLPRSPVMAKGKLYQGWYVLRHNLWLVQFIDHAVTNLIHV